MTAPHRPDPPDAAEPARDAWLREALRHAPDAHVEAPPALSAAILREARAAVATPRRVGAESLSRWSAAWAWLARPSVATGFASLIVAGFVGLLWRNGPIDPLPAEPALELRRAGSPPAAPASVAEIPNVPLAPQAGTARIDSRADRHVLAPLPPASAPLRVPPPEKFQMTPAAAPRGTAAKEVSGPALPPTSAPAEPSMPRVGAASEKPAGDARARTEARMRSDASTAAAEAAGPLEKLAETPPPQGRLADRLAQGSNRDALDVPAQPSPRTAVTEMRRMAPSAAAASMPGVAERLRAVRSRIADEPGRWRWHLDAGARRPVDAALLDWLARLERALVPGAGEPAGAGPVLTLWRDGERAGRIALHVATATLTLDDASARLDPAALAALQAALADLLR